MASEFVCSVEKENKLGFYRLHTIFLEDKLKIKIASKDAAWSGEVSKEKLSEMASVFQKNPETYLAECKESLTTPDGKPDVVYAVDDGSFTWKQVIDEDAGVKVKLGAIPLKPASFADTIQDMMGVSLNANKSLLEQVSKLTEGNARKENNVNELILKLEEYQKTKDTMENDLYTKFVEVLNMKKRKICQLEEEVVKVKAGSGPSSPRKKARVKTKVKDDVPLDPYDEDTEEDVPGPSTRATTSRQNRAPSKQELPKRRKSKKSASLAVDKPLIDSDATITDDELIFKASCRLPRKETSTATSAIPISNVEENISKSELPSFRTSPVSCTQTISTTAKSPKSLPSGSKGILDFFFGADDSPEPIQSMTDPILAEGRS